LKRSNRKNGSEVKRSGGVTFSHVVLVASGMVLMFLL
jgi:hypothetical protein